MTKFADYLPQDEAQSTGFQPEPTGLQEEQPVAEPRRLEIPVWLKAETGAGDVSEYETHVLNFNKSRGLARVIRGLTGMFGSLNYAAVDVILGVLEMGRERKAKQTPVEVPTNAATGY